GAGRPLAVVGLVAVGLAPLVFTTVLGQAGTNGEVLATRYRDPEFVRYDAADAAAARWLAGHVRPGETILNNANDGSTLAYVRHELPILGVVSSGSGRTPDLVDLLADFHDYPEDPRIRSLLREHDVRWVYVDIEAPLIGAVPSAWHGQSEYALAPGLTDLDGLPGLRPAFRADTVTVYELTLPGVP
uniref:DUF6541 family protein n=1 Tax=Saccharomonospora iraqiensis TaxID=52698 RepID=UPI00047EFD23